MAGCALVGGETAEMPSFYPEGEYELAGFCVGIVERSRLLDGSKIVPGDILLGLSSSGLHSNGYSLVRKLLLEKRGYSLDVPLKGFSCSLGEELLKPTKIYVKPILQLLEKAPVKGLAHITGGGLLRNIPRILPESCKAHFHLGQWPVPQLHR
jgi:phosphoribosylformylglycinamidine cyclo-ligase